MTPAFIYTLTVYNGDRGYPRLPELTQEVYLPSYQVVTNRMGGCFKCDKHRAENMKNLYSTYFPIDLAIKVAHVANLQFNFDEASKSLKLGRVYSFQDLTDAKNDLEPCLNEYFKNLCEIGKLFEGDKDTII
jgi:hypothetical protein